MKNLLSRRLTPKENMIFEIAALVFVLFLIAITPLWAEFIVAYALPRELTP